MRLTTARYYTPSGRSIQAKGIEPDIKVDLARIESLAFDRVRESDLKGALDKSNGEKKKKPANDNKDADASDAEDAADAPADKEEAEAIEDYQLSRALDLLSGLKLYRESKPDVVTTAPAAQPKTAVQ